MPKRGRKGRKGGGARGSGHTTTMTATSSLQRQATSHRFKAALAARSLTGPTLNPFPPTWRTEVTIRALGSISSGGAHAAQFAEVKMNSVFTPLNTSTPPPNLVGGSTTSSSPSGVAELLGANGPYTDFRVLGSAVSIEMLPESAADNLFMCVAPFLSSALPTTTLGTATSMGGVSRMCGFSQGSRAILRTKVSTAVVAGATDEEAAVTSTLLGNPTTDPSSLYYWVFAYCLGVNQVTTAAITYSICVSYDVVLESPQWKALADANPDEEKSGALKGNSACDGRSAAGSAKASASKDAEVDRASDEDSVKVERPVNKEASKSTAALAADEEWTATRYTLKGAATKAGVSSSSSSSSVRQNVATKGCGVT